LDLPLESGRTRESGPDLIEIPRERESICVSVYRVCHERDQVRNLQVGLHPR
jgi:hypothetical protein